MGKGQLEDFEMAIFQFTNFTTPQIPKFKITNLLNNNS